MVNINAEFFLHGSFFLLRKKNNLNLFRILYYLCIALYHGRPCKQINWKSRKSDLRKITFSIDDWKTRSFKCERRFIKFRRKDVIITSNKLHPTHPIRLKGKLSNRRTNAQTNEVKQWINKRTNERANKKLMNKQIDWKTDIVLMEKNNEAKTAKKNVLTDGGRKQNKKIFWNENFNCLLNVKKNVIMGHYWTMTFHILFLRLGKEFYLKDLHSLDFAKTSVVDCLFNVYKLS